MLMDILPLSVANFTRNQKKATAMKQLSKNNCYQETQEEKKKKQAIRNFCVTNIHNKHVKIFKLIFP